MCHHMCLKQLHGLPVIHSKGLPGDHNEAQHWSPSELSDTETQYWHTAFKRKWPDTESYFCLLKDRDCNSVDEPEMMIVSEPWIIKGENTSRVFSLLDTIIAEYGDADSLSLAGLSVEVRWAGLTRELTCWWEWSWVGSTLPAGSSWMCNAHCAY